MAKYQTNIKQKDYFGSKRNEVRYNRLKKRGINNPLNIMNRAIINLNNSRTNSESSQERSSGCHDLSTPNIHPSKQSNLQNVEESEQKVSSSTVAFKTNYEDIISNLHRKQMDAPAIVHKIEFKPSSKVKSLSSYSGFSIASRYKP